MQLLSITAITTYYLPPQLGDEFLCFVPDIFDNLNCIHGASLISSVLCNNIPHILLLIIRCICIFRRPQSAVDRSVR
jgi:hypothetical protein